MSRWKIVAVITIILTVVLLLNINSQQNNGITIPHVFNKGVALNANELNENFLVLKKTIDALQIQLKEKMEFIPIGTVIASLIAPDIDGNYMTGSMVWAFADGTLPNDATTYTRKFPDLRGMFLRGVNYGRIDDYSDPGQRTNDGDVNFAGSFEKNTFQGHSHACGLAGVGPMAGRYSNIDTGIIYSGRYEGSSDPAAPTSLGTKTSPPVTDGVDGTPNFSKETRPSNVAIYWYIKVK